MKFDWGARKGRDFEDCQFSVSFNGVNLKTVNPADYQLHSETIEFDVKSNCLTGEVKFCGVGGASNSYGAFIKGVSLKRKPCDDPIQLPPHVYPTPPTYVLPPLPTPTINIGIQNPTLLTPPPIGTPVLPLTPPVINTPTLQVPNYVLPTPTVPVVNIQYQQPPILPQPPIVTPPCWYLESHSGKCYQKEYNLEGGQHEVHFDYRLMSTWPLKDSTVVITHNGQPVHRVLPCDDGKTIKVVVNAVKGPNVFSFCPVGCPTEPQHSICLSNVFVYWRQCVGKWSDNLIVNGGFEQNDCQSSWCIWNQPTTNVPGWIPSPEIEIGKATVYTNSLGSSWVAELDPNANTCIKQKVNVKPGKHVLEFDWASRSGVVQTSNVFEVRINGQVLKSVAPGDYNAHHEKIEFDLQSCPQDTYIEFCGAGKSDSLGAVIDNVQLFEYDECASWSVLKCWDFKKKWFSYCFVYFN